MTSDASATAHARFDCAACGGVAGIVRLVPAGTPAEMGSPIGEQEHQSDGVAIDYWIGASWQKVSPATYAKIRDVLAREPPDAGRLHTIHWELAPFWCRECQHIYCRDHWERIVIMDEGFSTTPTASAPRATAR